jgi:hypothetical protein
VVVVQRLLVLLERMVQTLYFQAFPQVVVAVVVLVMVLLVGQAVVLLEETVHQLEAQATLVDILQLKDLVVV